MDTKRMRACAPLLGEPGCGAVIDCLDEIERLRAELALAKELIASIDAAIKTDRTTTWTSQPMYTREERFAAWNKVATLRVLLEEGK